MKRRETRESHEIQLNGSAQEAGEDTSLFEMFGSFNARHQLLLSDGSLLVLMQLQSHFHLLIFYRKIDFQCGFCFSSSLKP